MFPPYEFYKYFMVDYFLYKQVTYKNILDNYSKVESIITNKVFDFKKEDYFNTLKSSIRITYFHSIETLFELIFALEQGIRSEVNEHQNKDELSFITKDFDTQRDFNMTILTSDLISNIINIRKVIFFNMKKEKFIVKFFDEDILNEFSKINIKSRNFKFTWK